MFEWLLSLSFPQEDEDNDLSVTLKLRQKKGWPPVD